MKLLLLFATIGLAAATTSSYVHYKLVSQPGYASACDINATVSCTQAYLSPYGSAWGVPIALFGVGFFLFVLLLAGLGGRARSPVRDAVPLYVLALSTIGLGYVVYLGWASYVQLQVFCILCAITYASTIALFIVSLVSVRATSVPMTTLPRRMLQDLRTALRSPLALLVAVIFIGGGVAAIASFPRENITTQEPAYPPLTAQQKADLEKWWSMQPVSQLPISNDGARVLVVKFSDYMCPACRQTYEGYKGVLGKYLTDGQVKYVVKHFPLEAECNPKAAGDHYASCEAAAAVIMARPNGTAAALEQWIFANQAGLTPESVKKAAKDIGGIQNFDQQYARTLEEVKTDTGLGALLNINRTPTFFINGRRISDQVLPPQYFDYLIELALKGK